MNDSDARNENDFWREEPTGLQRVLSGLRRTGTTGEQPVTPAAPTAPRRPRTRPTDTSSRSRRHAAPSAPTQPFDPYDPFDERFDPFYDTDRAAPAAATTSGPAPRRPIDPLLARIGAMTLVVAFLVPVAVSLRGGDTVSRLAASTPPPSGQAAQIADPATTPASPPVDPASLPPATPVNDPAPLPPATTVVDPKTLPPATPVVVEAAQAAAQPSAAGVPEARAVEHAVVKPTCTNKYTIVAGDYWILIAKKVSVSLKDLLAANGATTSTALYAGRSVCLPANASPPTTVAAPATTVKPAAKPAAPAPTTTVKPKAPTTTAAPATTQPAAPKRTYTRAEVIQIIRDVWPDELEEEAIRIATRESSLLPTAKNYCCYGLFQIYFNVHKSWLANMWIGNSSQLFDPRVNAEAAYVLYQRSGGWGPWKL